MGNGLSSFDIRMARASDASECHEVDVEAWGAESAASITMFEQRIARYPSGNFVAIHRPSGQIAATVWSVATGDGPVRTWDACTGGGTYEGVVDFDGPRAFGVNLAARKAYSGQIAKTLTGHCVESAWIAGKREFVFGARISDYHRWRSIFYVNDYVGLRRSSGPDPKVFFLDDQASRIHAGPSLRALESLSVPVQPRDWPVTEGLLPPQALDRELAFFLSIRVRGVACQSFRLLPGYFPDPSSCDYGVLVGWERSF